MPGSPQASANRSAVGAPQRSPRRQFPLWAMVVALVAVGLLIVPAVFTIGDYVVAHTTVTVDLVSWGVSINGQSWSQVSCQGSGGFGGCPYHVKPGSVYTTAVYFGAYYAGRNVTLFAPSPFSIASTSPSLPASIPASGISVTVHLALPSAPGEYSFTGNVTFS